MTNLLEALLTAFLAFSVTDYVLGRALVKDPLRAVIAAVFALIVVFVAGVLVLTDVIS